jgi:hypothetical protein
VCVSTVEDQSSCERISSDARVDVVRIGAPTGMRRALGGRALHIERRIARVAAGFMVPGNTGTRQPVLQMAQLT